MKRFLLSVICFTFALSALMAFAPTDAGAVPPKHYKHHHYYHHQYQNKPAHWVVPPPSGKSTWCKKHKSKCKGGSASDPKVNSPYEHCMDKAGDGNGRISGFEKDRFGGVCK